MKPGRPYLLILALAPAGLLPAQQLPSGLKAIQDKAMLHSHAYSWLQELSDGIGPRLTGSPQAAKAAQWTARKMEQIGLRTVHLEPWQMARGWQRVGAQAELISPYHLSLNIASYGWTGSTPGSVEAELVLVNRDALDEALQKSSSWAGKVVFLAPLGPKSADGLRVSSQLDGLLSAAYAAHAVAVIDRDSRPGVLLTHTEPVTFRDASYSIPVVDIAAEHQKLIERLLQSGASVRMKISVENEFSSGPVDSANIVGDIPGSEHPEQVVILAAHLDSWDLGTGAIDDGVGVAAILSAAEAILASGLKPRRTIRLVFFTGEEQGLLGSRAWVRAHASDIPNLICALALDWGQGPITSIPLAGHKELASDLQPLVELLSSIQPVKVRDGYLNFTDAYSFSLAGVPGLAFLQDSRDYSLIGHSAADTLDKVDAGTLVRNSAVIALTAFWIADHPTRLGEVWSPSKTAQRLAEDHQRPMLEVFGLWDFPSTVPLF